MAIIYSPLLLITAWIETKQAHHVRHNRAHHELDEDTVEEWEEMEAECNFDGDGWSEKVEASRPNVETDAAVLEVRELKQQVEDLIRAVEGWKGENGAVHHIDQGP